MITPYDNIINPGFYKKRKLQYYFWNGIRDCYTPLVLENNLKRCFGKLSSDSNYANKSPNYKD